MTTYYCAVEDVANILGMDTIDETTSPSYSQVESIINTIEDEIDRYTGHAWREKQSEIIEYREVGRTGWRHPLWTWFGFPLVLGHRMIRTPLDKNSGDMFEVYIGNTWEDWLDGSHDDYFWVDDYNGIIYIKIGIWGYRWRWARVRYRYGDTIVPGDIKMACTLLSAAYLLEAQQRWVDIPEGTSGVSPRDRIQAWRSQAYSILDRHMEYEIVW